MAAQTTTNLPATHRALVLTKVGEPVQLKSVPMPKTSSGSAVIRVEAAGIVSYAGEILSGVRQYPYPTPYTPGAAGVGRVVALGHGATTLRVGDRVLTEVYIRGRDDDDVSCLQGVHQGLSDASRTLVEDPEEHRNGNYAEYAKVAFENCHKIPDTLGEVKLSSWLWLAHMLVPFGGLTNEGGLDLKPGETIVIAPATGSFSGAGVELALAMGARVVAVGRSADALQRLEKGLAEYSNRLRTVRMTDAMDAVTLAKAIGPVDCYLDLSPPMAANSIHLKACILALKRRGRACLMGGIAGDVALPHGAIFHNNLQITGKWMYERRAPRMLMNMVEAGVLKLGREESWSFKLEEWEKGFEAAAKNARWGQMVMFEP